MKNKADCFLLLWVLKCFTSPSLLSTLNVEFLTLSPGGFPHSEISGSKVARPLPEAYRSHTTSFIASSSQGIHHALLNFLLGNLKITSLNIILSYVYILPACLRHYKDPRLNSDCYRSPRQPLVSCVVAECAP